jgi:Flp pilus assembly protein TadD
MAGLKLIPIALSNLAIALILSTAAFANAPEARETDQLKQAEQLSWAKRYGESIQIYQDILKQNPQSLGAALGYAEVLSWDGQYDRALDRYQQLLVTAPNNEKALTGLANIALWQGNLTQALARFTALRQQFPDAIAIQIGLAKTYIARQEIKAARGILQPLIAQNNRDAIALAQDLNSLQSQTEFSSRSRSSGQNSLALNQTVSFPLGDSNLLQSVQVGYGKFTQPRYDLLQTTPLRFGIEGKTYPVKWQLTAGVDLFDRIAAQPFVEGKLSAQISPQFQIGVTANHQSYKENIVTLENGINVLRIQPHLYWQITPSTSLYAQYGAGFYSDRNRDGQFWTGLKQRLAGFYLEGSVFSWRYREDPQNGYFAPSDYFSYGGELGWQGKIAEPATCQLAFSLGRQSYDDQTRPENGYKAGCKLDLSPRTSLDTQYRYSSSALATGEGASSKEHRIQVHLKTRF